MSEPRMHSEAEKICEELQALHERSRIRSEQIAVASIYHRARALADSLVPQTQPPTT